MMTVYSEFFGRKFNLEELEKNGPALYTDGNAIYLIHQAYVDADGDYIADAVDAKGNAYSVCWETAGDYDPDNDDEGDACDWANPVSIARRL